MSDLMATHFAPLRQPVGRAAAWRRIGALRVMVRTFLTRQELPKLTARELADIGITPAIALAEAARLPWDATPGPRRPAPSHVLGPIEQAMERARTRRLISRMQAREYRDFGVSLSGAPAEANKPFWRR